MTSTTLTVLCGTSLLGCVAGVVGSFAVLRRRALVGDVLAHAALPGLCLAFLLTGQGRFLPMLGGAFAAGLAALAFMGLVCRWTRTKEDAAIGIVLSTFFGAGIVLWSLIQRRADGRQAGLETYLYGQAATLVRQDVGLIALASLLALVVVCALYKEFKVFSFDPEFAQAQGWPVLTLDLLMMGALTLVTMAGLPAVGVVLMAAMLIVPGAAARFWTSRLGPLLVLAGALGAASAAAGTLLSSGLPEKLLGFDPLAFGHSKSSLPTGPLIVLAGTAVFGVSLFCAPGRGLAARGLALLRLRRTTARLHLLRTLYELSEADLPRLRTIDFEELLAARSWGALSLRWLVRAAQARGLVERTASGVRLTAAGLERAAAATRAHRLWELYLIGGAGIAPDHVDRDADAIEHYLGPEIVAELEAALAGAGQLPALPGAVPASPHELAGAAAHEGARDVKRPGEPPATPP